MATTTTFGSSSDEAETVSRGDSAKGCARQEPWVWGDAVEAVCRRAIELRYRLLPYLYSLMEEASRTGAPALRPLFYHYAEDTATLERGLRLPARPELPDG
jgi:alpha-glucosidase (family GH31 glycosyl hydrolase)